MTARLLSRLWPLILLLGAPSMAAAGRVPWNSNRVVGSPNPPAPYTVERLFPKLTFSSPVDVVALPGSDRLLVLEQGGKLLSFPAVADVDHADLVFNFRKNHDPFDSAYSLTFHPKFKENRFVFVCYAEPGGRTDGSHVSRFTLRDSDPPVIEPGSEKVILRWLSGGHNGGCLAFGNDGLLYISAGDASNPDPPDLPYRTGQDLSDLLANILRIDVDHAEGTNAYAIPSNNPFIHTPGARPEIYAFGLRNPWRISFDRPTGDLWTGDVGFEQWEMIHRVKAGGNYGWSITEGPNLHVRTDVKPGPGPILPPLVALPHSEAASITGGRVYHGQKLPKLRGAYLYGDWETGKFWALRHEGDRLVSNDELCDTTLKPVSFGEDREGELLIVDYTGGLYRFIPSGAGLANLAFPRKLSDTGAFTNLAMLAPAPGVVAYRINTEAWHDYAEAERVVGVPGDTAIATAGGPANIAGGTWNFPANTVFAKTLTLELQRGQTASRRHVETQLLHFDGQGWNAYTYRWNSAQTDADLVAAEGANETFTVRDPAAPGGQREVPWRFASRAECLRCHNAWAGDTLSFSWAQLNTPGTVSELGRLEQLGVLQVKDAPRPIPQLANPYDATLALDDRARSWLQMNCAPCHRNGAGGGVPAWFNRELSLEATRAYDTRPIRGDFGIVGARVIAPADPFRSTLFYRISTEGSGRMPHIGSRLVDERGVALMRDWIASLPAKADATGTETAAHRQLAAEIAVLLKTGETSRLLSTMNGALALLGSLAPKAAAAESQALIALATTHTNALVRDLFQRLLPPDRRRPTLGADFDPQVVLSLKGEASRGRELFAGAAQCARCHVVGGVGRAYGPELTAISAKYDRAQLLEQVLNPSKVIAPEFVTTAVTLKDDSELSGFVIARTATGFTLRDESLTTHAVRLADVKEARESTVSAMPEGLLAPLTAQEAADLIEFLLTRPPGK